MLDYAPKYHDVLLDIFIAGLENKTLNECCVFILTDELGEKVSKDGFKSELSKRGIILEDYPEDKYSIVPFREIYGFGDIQNGYLRTPFTSIAKYHIEKIQPRKYDSLRVLAEVTSRVMLEIDNPGFVLEYEEDLKGWFHRKLADINPFKIDYLPYLPMTIVCTHRIEHLQEVARKGKLPFQETIERLVACHDKVIVLTKEEKLLTGPEAEGYIAKVMSDFIPKKEQASNRR